MVHLSNYTLNPSAKLNPDHSLFSSLKHAKCRQSEVRHLLKSQLFIHSAIKSFTWRRHEGGNELQLKILSFSSFVQVVINLVSIAGTKQMSFTVEVSCCNLKEDIKSKIFNEAVFLTYIYHFFLITIHRSF